MNNNNHSWNVKKYLCIIVLLLLNGCSAEPSNPQWVTVEHEQYKFSIDYPTKWIVDLYGEAGHKGAEDNKLILRRPNPIFGLPSSPTTFSILVEWRAFDNPSLEEALAWGNETIDRDPVEEGLQTKPGYEEFLFQEEKITDYSAIRHRYTYFNLAGVVKEEIYIPRQNDMITISLSVDEEYFDNFYPDFQQIVNSFETIPSN